MELEVILTKFTKFHFVCGAEICATENHRRYISTRDIKAEDRRTAIFTVASKVSDNLKTETAKNNRIIFIFVLCNSL